MRYAVIGLLICLAVPGHAVWVEVDSLSRPCRAAGRNVTFTAGDFLEDGRHGWVVGTYRREEGERLAVLRTSDGRNSWIAVWTDMDVTPITSVDFADPDHGWIIRTDRSAYYTEDGGLSWRWTPGFGTDHELHDLHAVDATQGFIAGNTRSPARACIFRFRAEDRQWEPFLTDTPGTLHALAANSAELLWAAGLTPAGVSLGYRRAAGEWQPMPIPSAVKALSFVDARRGYAAATSGRIFDTSDGGASWREKSTPVLADLSDLHFSSLNEGVALSAAGDLLLVTKNRGDAWAVERTPDGAHTLMWDGSKYLVLTPTGLHVREELRTLNPVPDLQRLQQPEPARILPLPGPLTPVRTWREAAELVELLQDTGRFRTDGYFLTTASFLDDGVHGWIVGRASSNLRAILRTRNGGQTWDLLLPTDPLPNSPAGVHFVDANNGWIWGGDPLICRTRDGGATWEAERCEGAAAASLRVMRQLSMFDAERGLAVADVHDVGDDMLLRRTAAGTWQTVTAVGNFAKLATYPPDYLWIGHITGRLLAGTDLDSLRVIMSDTRQVDVIDELMLHDRNVGWVLPSQRTHIWRTTDGGETWSPKRFASDAANYAIDAAIAGPNRCYILTRLGHVLHTRDGGESWEEVHRLPSVVEPHRGSIYVFGGHCYVLAGNEPWTTVPPREPARITTELEPLRPVMADRLLSWSEDGRWAGDGVSPATGRVGAEAVFRVQWDRRNSRLPGQLTLQMRLPAAAGGIPMLATLRPADWWQTHETGARDWGVGFTPTVAGRYEYRFFGTNEEGREVTGEPTEWRHWTVE
ncbi:MAG: WD40/YVTN/BNR-like repeat-containing protein [Armatimonadota bacterium]|jgi:photosystem II stability/assembly factor-like uncharacterized protein